MLAINVPLPEPAFNPGEVLLHVGVLIVSDVEDSLVDGIQPPHARSREARRADPVELADLLRCGPVAPGVRIRGVLSHFLHRAVNTALAM